jgi:hypothetical protein
MTSNNNIKDSGSRQSFDTGAVRDAAEGKPMLGLISPIFEQRLGAHLTAGAMKYSARNWEKGIPLSRSTDSLLRHLNAWREGQTDEDHLAAAACNIMFIIHTEEMTRRGILPEALADMPSYMPVEVEQELVIRNTSRRDWCMTCEHREVCYNLPPGAACPGCDRIFYGPQARPNKWEPRT